MKISKFAILFALILSFSTQFFAQENAKLPTANEVFTKYINAIGGKEAYTQNTSRIYKGTLEIAIMNITGTFEMFFKSPNKSLVSLDITGSGENKNGFDGTVAWAKNAIQGLRTKSGNEFESVKSNADFYYSVNLETKYPKAEVIKTDKIGEVAVYVVKADENTTLFFEQQTGFLKKSDRIVLVPEGNSRTTTTFEDYREVNGIKYPHTWRQSVHGGEMVLKITEIKHNSEIDDSIFSKPKS